MKPGQLNKRFDDFVAGVTNRIGAGEPDGMPFDPAKILRVNQARFELQAITLHELPPRFYMAGMREKLQEDVDVETLADQFVATWRNQLQADNPQGIGLRRQDAFDAS